jgi:HSP20 family molecular chaperone IbpA
MKEICIVGKCLVKVPPQRLSEDHTVFSNVTVGEREVGRFMRCFVFPGRVDVEGLKTSLVDGLLRIDVLGVREQSEWGYDLCRDG